MTWRGTLRQYHQVCRAGRRQSALDERLERDPLASLARRSGDAKAEKAVGGNRRSMRMKRHAGVIRALVDETPDKECRTALAVRGVSAIRPVALALVAFGARPPAISVGRN